MLSNFQNASRLELYKSFKFWIMHIPDKRQIGMIFYSSIFLNRCIKLNLLISLATGKYVTQIF